MNLTNYEIYHEDKSHTSPEFPYNTYLCSIPLDFSAVNMHWHEEAEIIVILQKERRRKLRLFRARIQEFILKKCSKDKNALKVFVKLSDNINEQVD